MLIIANKNVNIEERIIKFEWNLFIFSIVQLFRNKQKSAVKIIFFKKKLKFLQKFFFLMNAFNLHGS